MINKIDAVFPASPTNQDLISEGNEAIQATRGAIIERIQAEHLLTTSDAMPQVKHGMHKEGSARAYVSTNQPSVRPDGVTSFNADDKGRLWYDGLKRGLKIVDALGAMVHTNDYNSLTRQISSGTTVVDTDRTILVTSNDAMAVTLTAGLPLGFKLTVRRTASGLTTNGVTLTCLSGETINGQTTFAIFGNYLAKTTKYVESFTIEKVGTGTYILTEGEDSGFNSVGYVRKIFSGEVEMTIPRRSYPEGLATYDYPTRDISTDPANIVVLHSVTPYADYTANYAVYANTITQYGLASGNAVNLVTVFIKARWLG